MRRSNESAPVEIVCIINDQRFLYFPPRAFVDSVNVKHYKPMLDRTQKNRTTWDGQNMMMTPKPELLRQTDNSRQIRETPALVRGAPARVQGYVG